MNRLRYLTGFAVLLLLVGSGFVYASGGGEQSSASTAAVSTNPLPYEETFSFSHMVRMHPNHGDNPTIWFEVGDIINADIEWILVPPTNYTEKLNTVLASGDLPDVVETNATELTTWIDQGAAVDITDQLPVYGRNILDVYTDDDLSRITNPIDGRIYSVAGITEIVEAYSWTVRRDWLEALNLDVPETFDELLTVLRAFRDNDMAGDGATIPFGGRLLGIYFSFGIMSHDPTDSSAIWTITDDDRYIPYYEHPNYRTLLESLAQMYAEGLLDREFFIRNRSHPPIEEIFAAGRVGAGTLWAAQVQGVTVAGQEADPDLFFMPIDPIIGPFGDQMLQSRDRQPHQAVITVDAEREGKVENALRFIDWGFSPEGETYWNFGVEGVHHEIVDGEPQLIPPYNQGWNPKRLEGLGVQSFSIHQLKSAYQQSLMQGMSLGDMTEVQAITYDGLFRNTPYLFTPVRVFDTPAAVEFGSDLYPFLREQEIKAIIGEISVDEFFEQLAIAKRDGLDQITEEMNQMYARTR